MIHLHDLLAATNGTVLGSAGATQFDGFAFDSRLVQGGELFVAVKSERGDGHDYIAEAVAKGARGLLLHQTPTASFPVTVVQVDDTQRALQRWGRYILRHYGTSVIGVTGSTGKTSTKEAIAQLLGEDETLFKNPGNWNGRYGLPLALGQLSASHRRAVLEMASDSLGEIADLAALAPPRLAVVTTVQPAHLDTFGNLDGVAAEKSALVNALPPDGLALLNGDDPRVAAMAAQSQAPVWRYGLGDDLPIRASEISLSTAGMAFTLHLAPPVVAERRSLRCTTPLLGRHLLYPILAAVGVALHAAIHLDEIVERIAALRRLAGRLTLLDAVNGAMLLDDSYNASPAAVLAALETLAELPCRRRVAVLGEMAELGQASDAAHAEVGRRAAQSVDQLVTKGAGAQRIAQAALAAGMATTAVTTAHTAEDAARAVLREIGEGDLVLLKGGMVARLEQVALLLLADPERDGDKLVRQNAAWQQIGSRPVERPTWIEVDLAAIAQNASTLKAIVGPDVALMAVVKADGYGHGALRVAQTALLNGATWLGVATVSEAQPLRHAGIEAPILVLGYTPAWQARDAVRLGLRVTLFSLDVAQSLSAAARALGRQVAVHIKVDTGMHRLGLPADEVLDFVEAVAALDGLRVEGLFTHFSVADSAEGWYTTFTQRQLDAFGAVLAALDERGMRPPIVHAANSAGTLAWPAAHFDMVRPGIALYGLAPSADVALPDGLRPALSWKTQIAQVKRLPPDSYISYGATYRTATEEQIAVIPVGYADGFRRAPQNWGEVLVRGQRAPLVGRVCMDQAMIRVDHIPSVRQGDEVVLIGQQGAARLSAEEVAARLGTISYEVVSEILARVARV